MTFTPVEIIALVLIVLSTVKIVVLLINPKSWMNFAKQVWKNTSLTTFVSFVLAVLVFYYLIQEVSVVQILAVTAFIGLTMAVGLSDRIGELMKFYEKQTKNKEILRKNWLYILIWLVLLLWGLKDLLR